MTLRTRNTILFAATCAVTVLTVGLAAQALYFGTIPDSYPLIKAAVPIGISLVGLFGFFRYFRKVSGPLIFFFFFSLSSLLFESSAFAASLLQATELGFSASVILTRLNLFGLALGSLCLFTTSLYVSGVKYQNQGTVLVILIGLSSFIADQVPVITADPPVFGLFALGSNSLLIVMHAVVILLTGLNFVRSWIANQNPDEAIIGASVLGIMLGRWIMHSGGSLPVLVLGAALLVGGAVLYARKVFSQYLWY